MALRVKTDWILFTTIVLLVFFGAVMVYSASSVKAEQKLGTSYYYIERQGFWIAMGFAVMMLLKGFNYRKLAHPGVAFAFIGVVLILLIIVFFADPKQHRWIRIAGAQLQPSEFAKPAMMLFLAFFLAIRSRAINNKHTLGPAALAVGIMTFLVGLADFGTAAVLFLSAMAVFVVAGLGRRYVLIVAGVGLLAAVGLIVQKPYRLKRIIGFVDPQFKLLAKFDPKGRVKSLMDKSLTTKDTNYQVDQSKIAVGSGGWTGLGLMQGKQKLLYLPEAHTDMIYAVVGEEFGLLGTTLVLVAFMVIFWRGLRAAVLVPDEFGRYLALGITLALLIQAFMNISVALGMGPTKGIALPMISYGGTSLLSTMASLGVLLNLSENAG
ncbi:MAG TPA: putative peptidoglycan glycosyltransferase FtsW [Bryobacteraceae bacterium]|jgi:cell division protein FtsW